MKYSAFIISWILFLAILGFISFSIVFTGIKIYEAQKNKEVGKKRVIQLTLGFFLIGLFSLITYFLVTSNN